MWRTILAALLLPLSLIGIGFVILALFFVTLPDVLQLKNCMTTTMYSVKLCPGEGNYAPLNQISQEMIEAVIASEDAAFFSHQGFDWFEIRQSFSTNLKEKGFKRGGSTITQQLAKNVFLTKDKSILRKLREAAITVALEKSFTKKELIEKYLNVVEFGPNIYGVKAAAKHYFGKSPSQLHVLDAAFLAFLLPNPKGYSKSFSQRALTPFARKGISQIVNRLASFRKISEQTAQQAIAHIDQFPWSGLTREGLNAGFSPPSEDGPSDEQLEQVYEQELPAHEEPAVQPDSSEAADPDQSTWD